MAKAEDDMDPRPTRPVGAVPAPETAPDASPDGAPKKKPPRKRATPAKKPAPAKKAPAPLVQPAQPAKATKAERKAERAEKKAQQAPRVVQPVRRERRLRHTIQKVDLWSVLKLSLCFYLCSLAVIVVALVSLWAIADSFGIVENVEEFIGELLSSEDFTFLSGEMLRGVVLVGLVLVMLQVVITVIAGAFYNLFAALFGGLEVTVVEEETPAP
jgi:Transmembrane domain of unknown function (DUF3566)